MENTEFHEKVKKNLEAKGWDFSSDYFDDDELNSVHEVIDATLEESEKELDQSINFMRKIKPFTGDMWQFLLVNALRFLTEEQRAGLCFDLYCRSEIKELIDGKIQDVKSEKLQEEMERCKNDPEYFYKTYWEVKTNKPNS
jgi:hypothetical protein